MSFEEFVTNLRPKRATGAEVAGTPVVFNSRSIASIPTALLRSYEANVAGQTNVVVEPGIPGIPNSLLKAEPSARRVVVPKVRVIGD
jgi:hypothetical protein